MGWSNWWCKIYFFGGSQGWFFQKKTYFYFEVTGDLVVIGKHIGLLWECIELVVIYLDMLKFGSEVIIMNQYFFR